MRKARKLGLGLAVSAGPFFFSSVALAVEYPCSLAGLDAALASGGPVTFSCAAETTIVVPATRHVTSNVDLDGGGRLVISGGDLVRTIEVDAGRTATFSRLVIEHGRSPDVGSNLLVTGTLTLNDSTVRLGTDATGGAIYVNGSFTSNRSAIIDNADGAEGAVAVHGTATLLNTTISGNSWRGVNARNGGSVTVRHSTIVTTMGEALRTSNTPSAINVASSIVMATGLAFPTGGTGVVSQGYNIFNQASAGTVTPLTSDQTGVTPLLEPLALNGGSAPTRALQACSPGINAGELTTAVTTDQRGQPRLQNGAVDIGAHESDLRPCLYVDDTSVVEGNSGSTTALVFPVRISGASSLGITAVYTPTDGTATKADSDYAGSVGTVNFGTGGQLSLDLPIVVNGDANYEANETMTIALSSPSNVTLVRTSATGTITNDDARPTVSIGDVTVTEGTGGTTTANVTVSLSASSFETVSVSYATADGTALADADYTAASGTLIFAPGERTKTIAISVAPDALKEESETFGVNLTAPSNTTIADGSGTVTIVDDEANPGISIGGASIAEGNAGSSEVSVVVTLSPASATTVSVGWSTVDGTATVADDDFAATDGTLSFAPGETSKTITVLVSGDTKVELDESFVVRLSGATGAAIATADGTVTITNDDVEAPDAGPDAGPSDDDDAGADAGIIEGDSGNPVARPDGGSPSGTADGGAVGVGDAGFDFGSGSSDDDGGCSVAAIGDTSGPPFALFGVSISAVFAFLRRRRR